jgi:deazaflavin-dependent oxidoreductase (nitroreductase family)
VWCHSGRRNSAVAAVLFLPGQNIADSVGSKDTLKDRLARYRQIKISVTGRKSGRAISIPVWFVLEGEKLYLLPVQGSDTQWYKNLLQNPSIRIDARGVEAKFRATPITDAKAVKSVVEKFREKYGTGDVKKYYSKFDVAILIELG